MQEIILPQKIYDIESLRLKVVKLKNSNQKVGFTNGCFDVVHVGHVELLSFCKANCDFLIVGINSDNSVRDLKGNDRPIFPEIDRATVLSGLSCVDAIIIFEEQTPYRVISTLAPHVLIKGGDYKRSEIIGRTLVNDIKIFPYRKGYSTSMIIKRIKKDREKL